MYIYKYFFVKPSSTFPAEDIESYFINRCNVYQSEESSDNDYIIGSLFDARAMEQKMFFSDHTRDSHNMTESVINITSDSGGDTDLSDINLKLANLTLKMDALELLELESFIDNSQNEDARIADLVEDNKTSIEVANANIATNMANIADLRTLMEAANTVINLLETKTLANTNSVTSLSTLVSAIQNTNTNITNQLTNIVSRIDDLEALGFGSEVAQYSDDVVADASSAENVVTQPETNQVSYV